MLVALFCASKRHNFLQLQGAVGPLTPNRALPLTHWGAPCPPDPLKKKSVDSVFGEWQP